MALTIQERLKDLRVERGLTLEQLAATRHDPRSFGTFCPEIRLLAVLPLPGIPFLTVILFSRCCPSMNYPKSTPK